MQTALIHSLVEQEGIQRVDLALIGVIDTDVIEDIPPEIALKYKVIPFARDPDLLHVTMANPFDILAEEAIRAATNYELKIHFTPEEQINEWLGKYYLDDHFADYEEENDDSQEENSQVLNIDVLEDRDDDAPAIRYVNKMLMNAIQERASDIHVEPQEKNLKVRFRIDGALREVATAPKNLQAGIVSRIKIFSALDIAERRVPQDGRSKLKIFGRNIDIRVSTIPTINGEKVVLRVLDKDLHSLNIADLGIEPDLQEKLKESLHEPHGMILVTGPTGSGKTTTLYSALNYVNSQEKNIITIEDPVEYQLKGINQIQVKPDIDLTFSAGLRSSLRQDPDIIMVGEIRDTETADIAMRASLTGHLVFSTLHTNDSISTIMRLIDMGIDRYLICSSIHLVLAQRLVRRICFHCSETYIADDAVLRRLGRHGEVLQNQPLRLGRGCSHCGGTGYWGRGAIFEFFSLNGPLRNLIMKNASVDEIRKSAKEMGMESLLSNGLKKVQAGITTVDEVVRVTTDFS